jgi:hypothetical protein
MGVPPVLATVNCGLLFTERQVVKLKVVGETERVGGTGVDWVGEPFGPVALPCVPAGVCDVGAVVDVPLAAAVLPAEELDETSNDALAFDEVNGATTIEMGLRWVRA